MNIETRPQSALTFVPRVAAVTILFLGLSTNTHLDAASAWQVHAGEPTLPAAPQKHTASETIPALADSNGMDFGHILSPKDADLYRAVFAAQAKNDWKTADDILLLVKDKRLLGHVLADRYQRRGATLPEAQQWLAGYAELPEAEAIYSQAKHLARSTKIALVRPVMPTTGGKSIGTESSSGFHVAIENDNTREKIHTVKKINAALHDGDPIIAREFLTTETQRHNLPQRDQDELAAHIAAAFFYQGQIERARPMAHQAAMAGIPLGLWIDGLSSWKQHDYVFAARSFAALAQAPGLSSWDRSAAAYWAYRATKRTNDDTQARHWLAEAAKDPHSFYGALATSMTASHSDRSWKMPDLTAKDVALLSQKPAGGRALALLQVGKTDLAEGELRHLNLTSRDMQIATLALAEKAHMPTIVMQLSGVATNDNGQLYEAAQYPLPSWQPADGFKVDRALIYALIKHESHFDPTAVSQSGACGLMQIMPNTAHLISNDNQNGKHCPTGLFDPAINMAMGQKYVRVLAGQPMIGDNLLFLLAAYNGGPGNLVHWLDGDDRRDPLLFVESLPMRETRDYVQQVLLQYWMYRSRLSQPETTAAQLAHGEWPRYALHDTGTQQAQTQNVELASVDLTRAAAAR